MNCERVSRWLLPYLDGEVTEQQRHQIEAHLAECPTCTSELQELAALHADLAALMEAAGEAIHLPGASEARIDASLSERLKRRQPRDPLAILRGWLGRQSWVAARAVAILLLVAFVAAALLMAHPPGLTPPPDLGLDLQETMLLGQASFAPGSLAAVRVLVRQMPEGTPVTGAEVTLTLAAEGQSEEALELFSGRTGEGGTLPVSFHVPDDLDEGQYTLIVETHSDLGRDRLEQAITLQRSFRLLLTSDKPLYQPGQVIHMRVLALSTVDRRPAAGQPIEFTIEDPRENKLLRQQVVASEYGLAALDFALDSEATQGNYCLTATLGDTTSERVVTVGPYVLPKFGIQIETDKSYYRPGDRVEGHLQASYYFGKPVAGGQVKLRGVVYDVERSEEVFLHGQTDGDGRFSFAFSLPRYFAGSMLESGVAQFSLEVTITDQAEHVERTGRVLPVSDQAILIEAVAESGQLKREVENVIYLLASYPDGSPVEASLTIRYDERAIELATGAYGLAEMRLVPGEHAPLWLTIYARDADGNEGSRRLVLSAEPGSDHLLLRPEKAIYRVGETLTAETLAGQASGTVYLDVVHEGQTMLTRAAALEDGRAVVALDLTPDLAGTLELHAYQVLPDGTLVRDTRLVVVDAPVELSLEASSDKGTYRPGDTAQITFDVTDEDGQGVQAALGVGIVDESVYGLQELDPGFAKTYFLLEKVLAEPRYQIKGFSWSSLAGEAAGGPGSVVIKAQNASAAAALAAAPDPEFELQADSYPAKVQEAELLRHAWEVEVRQQRAAWAGRTGWVISLALVAIPLLLASIVLLDLRQERRSLRPAAWAAGLLLIVSPLLALWAYVLLDWDLPQVSVCVGLLELGALVVLVVEAWRRRIQSLKLALVAMAAYLAAVTFLLVTQPSLVDRLSTSWVLLVSLALLSGTLVLLALWWKAQGRSGLSAISIWAVVTLICGFGFLAMLLSLGTASAPPSGARQESGQLVVVARNPIGAGSVIRPDDVTLAERGWSPRGSATNIGQVVGAIAGRDFTQGEVILMRDLVLIADTGRLPRTALGASPPAEQATPEPPRLRQWFPETLYWNPEGVTDESGHLELPVALADSITTWRLSALASSQDGRLGGATIPLGVFQDFFVELDLPVALTQHDEIALPVAVYNYLPQPQTVRLEMAPAPWFELLGPPAQEVTLGPADVDVVYFRIRALEHGLQRLEVTAQGMEMSDALAREIRVAPDGKRYRQSGSDWLRDGEEQVVDIPLGAIPGASRIEVRVYPGPVSQVVEGLEGILRMPFG